MISLGFANVALVGSLLIVVLAYVKLSKVEGTYINVLVPSLIITIPAYYIFPWIYADLFGIEASRYAFSYVYATLAVENVAFVYAYIRAQEKTVRLPFRFSYHNFGLLAWICLGLSALIYVPLLLQFPEYLIDPREIYKLTRTGFGAQFFISSTLAYLAIIFILFTNRSSVTKVAVSVIATAFLLLHGSKGQVLNVILILLLFHIYVRGRKVGLKSALIAGSAIAVLILLLFAGTMSLGDGPREALEAISEYSDYTRNAMMVIDEHLPLQYGRLTVEGNIYGVIPRGLMPNKPKNFGTFFLAEEFYPNSFDSDTGSPAFGVGVQYADFGALAIVYLVLFALLRGWLARMFVNRLAATKHPADFLLVTFLADVTVFPIGGAGWLLPETLLLALLVRRVSRIGADKVYQDQKKTILSRPRILRQADNAGSA